MSLVKKQLAMIFAFCGDPLNLIWSGTDNLMGKQKDLYNKHNTHKNKGKDLSTVSLRFRLKETE